MASSSTGTVTDYSVEFVRSAPTAGCCYGVSFSTNEEGAEKVVCAMAGGVEIRDADLHLENKIDISGETDSAHLTSNGKLITKVCDFDCETYRT